MTSAATRHPETGADRTGPGTTRSRRRQRPGHWQPRPRARDGGERPHPLGVRGHWNHPPQTPEGEGWGPARACAHWHDAARGAGRSGNIRAPDPSPFPFPNKVRAPSTSPFPGRSGNVRAHGPGPSPQVRTSPAPGPADPASTWQLPVPPRRGPARPDDAGSPTPAPPDL